MKLKACRFRDLKVKDFISICSSVIPGLARKTKHHGKVTQPKVAEEDLKYTAAIDIPNHYCNGSAGLEDVWLMRSPPQKAVRWYIGVLLYQCPLSYEVFWKN